MERESKKLIVQSGAQDGNWGTPIPVLHLLHGLFGRVDLDLASNPHANRLVQAEDFYSEANPCPLQLPPLRGKVLWCNPPGPVEKVRMFWATWLRAIVDGAEGGFIAFNMDHWRSLEPAPPMERPLYCCVWPKRLIFVGAACQYNHPSVIFFTKHPGDLYSGIVTLWGKGAPP
jgi:hypothetical protein